MAESEAIINGDSPEKPAEQQVEREPRPLTEIIASNLELLNSYRHLVIETQEVEAIHKMRVTTRRLQAALDLIGSEVKAKRLKNQLRGWRRRLSLVRNYDVFLMLLEKEAEIRRGAHREQFELIKQILQKRRARRVAEVVSYFKKINVDSLAQKIGFKFEPVAERPIELASSEGEQNEPPANAGQARRHLTSLRPEFDQEKIAAVAANRLERRLAEFQEMAATAHPTTDPADLHQLRIAAKRVRYILEIVSEMGYGNPVSALRWLRSLQDRIGDWHDLHALEEEIIKKVSRPKFLKQHLVESSRMLEAAAHLQKKKERLVARLFPVRVPKYLATSSQRLIRALRRRAKPAG